MRVALIQSDICWNDPDASIELCRPLVLEGIELGATLLILPEMFTCGFSLPTGELAQQANIKGVSFLEEISSKHNVTLIGSLPEFVESRNQYFNTAYVCARHGMLHRYRKTHLFSYGDEQKLYSAGDQLSSVKVEDISVGVRICYDLRFPKAFCDDAEATDLFVISANWPEARREHWLTLLRARAIENQTYVIGVNRIGSGGGLNYSGDSCAFSPSGDQLCHLDKAAQVSVVDINPLLVKEVRDKFPTLRDRRPSLYRKN